MEDVQAIGGAAADAAAASSAEGASADQAGEAAAEAARKEAESREIHLPPEVVDQIAKASAAATVSELASQGALSAPEPPADDTDEPDDEHEAPHEDPPPQRKTFADRFLSGYNR